nr:uncharacterized protein LOC112022653 [Quercus suber]
MALNTGSKSLRDLMKARNKTPVPKETNKSRPAVNLPPPPPQLPADLGLKPIPELKKKRPNTTLEEGEVEPSKANKRQKVVKDQRKKRASFVESQKDSLAANADVEADVAVAGQPPKKRTFKKFSYRGVDLDALLEMSTDDLVKLFTARARRRYKFTIV